MAGLKEFRNSLVTAIVRYHNKKIVANPPLKEEDQIAKILDLYPQGMINYLVELNTESTKSDATRRPILDLVLESIKSINTYFSNKDPSNEQDKLQLQLAQLVTNIQLLLNTYQWNGIDIPFIERTVNMFGLAGAFGLSDSGTVLKQTLFPTLKLDSTSSKLEVELTIYAMIKQAQMEFLHVNNTLLLSEIRTLQNDSHSTKTKVATLEKQLTTTQSELKSAHTLLFEKRNKLHVMAGDAVHRQILSGTVVRSVGMSDCLSVGYNPNPHAGVGLGLGLLNLGIFRNGVMGIQHAKTKEPEGTFANNDECASPSRVVME